MKTVLCYGDSNTWGYNAASETRHPYEQRWTTLLAKDLGQEYLVIPEGLNGRTTVMPDPFEGEYKTGKGMLPGILESHHPVDLVVLMLGTNDLKHRWGHSGWDIARGIETLIQLIQTSGFGPNDGAPKILVVSPAADLRRRNALRGDVCGVRREVARTGEALRARRRALRMRVPGRGQHHCV